MGMLEIRWHGRGGQGAKTASTLLAAVAIEEGKYGQGFPEYGPERGGAPMKGFTRISDEPIRYHCGIYHPDIVVVLDPTLLLLVNVTEGLKEGGSLLVNTPLSPDEVRKRYGVKVEKLYTIDATKISLEEIGKPIPNTPMLGALIRAMGGMISLETVLSNIRKKFARKFPEKVIQGNLNAVKRAYEEVKG
ncbi:2-oxoacid:acceptor oxidoreductase family protein [bacterium]|nr:2-oxoacid:acceptor oxidoreductase family protein [bacterium]